MRRKKIKREGFKILIGILFFIIKIPYYLILGVFYAIKKLSAFLKEGKKKRKRAGMIAKYQEFKIIESEKGEFSKWESAIIGADSKIGIIIGARGSGKTAFGLSFLENFYARRNNKIYALGFEGEEMPSWINVIQNISQIENNSFVLIDEGGVLFSSRRAMSNPNKMLSDLVLISRHKNVSILFISQNSSNLDINVIRQADYLILKPSSLLQINFERRIIRDIYKETAKGFEKNKNYRGLAYIYSDIFNGFVENPLPSFWKQSISKSFKNR